MSPFSRRILAALVFFAVLSAPPAVAADFTLPSLTFPTGITSDGTHLWIASDAAGRGLTKVDPLTGAILGSIPYGRIARDIVWDGGSRIIVSEIDGFVSEVDVAGAGVVSSFPLPFRGGAIAWDGAKLFVGDVDSSHVITVTRDNSITGNFVPGDLRPEGMVYDAERGTLWVIELWGGNIHEISTSGTILRTCASSYTPGPFGLGGITLLGSTLYIVEPVGGDPTAGAHVFSLDRSTLVCSPPLVDTVEVEIDVLAGAIPARSQGRVGVAIFSSPSFDAASVDPLTLRLGPSGTEAPALAARMTDADGDGDIDLVAQFAIPDTLIDCSTSTLELTGKTTDGRPVRGEEEVRLVGCR